MILHRGAGLGVRLAATLLGCLLASVSLGGCSATGSPASGTASGTSSGTVGSTPGATWAPGEAIVVPMVGSGTDHYGWVQATAATILATYYPPGSHNYIGGQAVRPTDRIMIIKMHGTYDHSAPFGGKSTASLALDFYNLTTGRPIPFAQLWEGDAPDLGGGFDPGITDREQAAKRWDLRLVGTPAVRTA